MKRGWILFVSLLLAVSLPLMAQHTPRGKGRIQGVVLDQFGKPIPDATVEAVHLESGFKRTTKTDEEGKWAILGLGTGMWRITARAKGYFPASTEQFVRQLSRNPDITLTLRKMSGLEALMSDKKAMKNLEEGNKLFEEGKYQEALEKFQEILKEHPDVFELHINLGNIYYELKDYDRAEQEFKYVIQEAEKHREKLGDDVVNDIIARAYAGIGNCYVKKKDYARAKEYYEKSIKTYANNAGVAFNLGEIYYAENNLDKALEMYKLATRIKPSWALPYYKLGYVYLAKAELEKSLEAFKKFLSLADENSPKYKEVKGLIPEIEGMLKPAKKCKD